jgi:hypothetical protein
MVMPVGEADPDLPFGGRTQCRADQNAYHEGGDDSGGGLLDHPSLERTPTIGQNLLYGRPTSGDARGKLVLRSRVSILLSDVSWHPAPSPSAEYAYFRSAD